MRKSIHQILAALLATSLASLSSAQPSRNSPSEKAAASGEFLLSWTFGDTSEIDIAAKRHELAEQQFKAGNLPKELIEERRIEMERIFRNAPRLLTIRSGGGPLSAFLAAASKDRERTINLINAGDAADLETQLPPFVLRNVTWSTVLNVLGNFLQPRGLDLRFVGGDHPDLNLAKSVVCVLRRIDQPQSVKATSQPEFESLQISDCITDKQTFEIIANAIVTAWEFDPRHIPKSLRLKFHPASGILLVSGPAPATALARQIVAELRKNPVQR